MKRRRTLFVAASFHGPSTCGGPIPRHDVTASGVWRIKGPARNAAMSRTLCLTRECLGMTTRIECMIRPLSGDNGLWTLLCAAGMSGSQPSAIKVQGPFHGPFVAEGVLDAIAECLAAQGYAQCDEPQTWCLHLHGELRKLNQSRRPPIGSYALQPES
jgi:hypothetical protein